MKHAELVLITEFLTQFKKISSISRADDNVLKIYFERGLPLFVDLSRNDSYMFQKEDFKRSKLYNAPFDVILAKRFANSALERVEVEEGNRILRLHVKALAISIQPSQNPKKPSTSHFASTQAKNKKCAPVTSWEPSPKTWGLRANASAKSTS